MKLYNRLSLLLSRFNKYPGHHLKAYLINIGLLESILITSLLITGLTVGIRKMQWLQLLELATFDKMVRLQPDFSGSDVPQEPRLLVVEITESDIQKQNRFPISDLTLAKVLQKLQQAQPRVIGLDLYRNVPQPPGHNLLVKELQASNIITIIELKDIDQEGVSPIPGIPPERIGFNDLLLDADGVIRRNLLYAKMDYRIYYSFAVRLVLKYLQKDDNSLQVTESGLNFGENVFPRLYANSGGYVNIDNRGRQVLISWNSSSISSRRVSLTQVLEGKVNPDWIKGKIVLIGTSAPSKKDLYFTPHSAVLSGAPKIPGVFVHAQLVRQLLSTTIDKQPLFWFWDEWVEVLWIYAWALVGGIIASRFRHPFSLLLSVTLALGILFGICFALFLQAGWIPLIPPALVLMLTTASIIAYQQLYYTLHDLTSNLPNRELFLKRLQWLITDTNLIGNRRFAVMFLDIDRFKLINESFGHHVGDKLLIEVTYRLKSCIGSKKNVARVGGDEFAILLDKISDSNEAIAIADKLQKVMSLPFKNNSQEIFTSVSIGIAFNQPELDHQAADLLRDAHTAMYRAKDLGKARHQIFASGMHTQVIKRLQIEVELRNALKNHEFYLNYQPIISLETEKIIGFEALVRWQHPERGFISPGEFIPVAEETGLIIPLGRWIFRQACQQLYVWQTQFPTNPPLMMSINLSGQELNQPDLVESIEDTLITTGVKEDSIKLEITETVAMQDVETAISILLRLRDLNLRLSIDDFGTGYSSLSYLHRFPINTLKVDRSFVNRMGETDEDAAIVRTIITLSHTLGMDVVAEGIETEAQKEQLYGLGCEYGQGYLFSPPLDTQKATQLLLLQQFESQEI
ncbi:MAG: EAL domain-containing protein [Calothrix sp. MO_167.B12]|nr:EAL domain-containing protein [Calothrix sp. MO_167.B12]